ncbi:MAG: Hsp20/alpha crystallin family protein [Alphaproteobacteria bacterium]|nr:Hsp20/alpha crystallin family protein [Alphaproteobacteria bacterium]
MKSHGTVAQRPEMTRTRPLFIPQADIYETDEGLTMILDMPGVAPGDIDVTLDRHVLTINGHCSASKVTEGMALVQAEFRDGDYQRSFTLSEAIDGNRIEAGMKDGVLKLKLPKASPIPAKTITVMAG